MKENYKNIILYFLLIIGAFLIIIFIFSKNRSDQATVQKVIPTSIQKTYSSPPKLEIDKNKKYQAEIITSKGSFKIDLFAKETPKTVNNFVFLAKEGFYDGTIFHRIIKDFMIQGGDPKGDGTGGPGYKFEDERITRDYKRGIVAMANSGPNTNGSQFFIMHKDFNLPKNYVIFGQVVEGMEIVDKIAETPVVDNGLGEKSKPTQEIRIEKIIINEK